MAKLEIRNFVFEGLKDVEKGSLLDFDEAFDGLEKRYQNEKYRIAMTVQANDDIIDTGDYITYTWN